MGFQKGRRALVEQPPGDFDPLPRRPGALGDEPSQHESDAPVRELWLILAGLTRVAADMDSPFIHVVIRKFEAVHLKPEIGPGLLDLRNFSPVPEPDGARFMLQTRDSPHVHHTRAAVILVVPEDHRAVRAGLFPDDHGRARPDLTRGRDDAEGAHELHGCADGRAALAVEQFHGHRLRPGHAVRQHGRGLPGHPHFRPRDRQRDAGQAPAAADVKHGLPVKVRHRRQRIQQVVAHHTLGVAHCGEVVDAVPLDQQRNILHQLCTRRRLQF